MNDYEWKIVKKEKCEAGGYVLRIFTTDRQKGFNQLLGNKKVLRYSILYFLIFNF